jgi:hypothetical protein
MVLSRDAALPPPSAETESAASKARKLKRARRRQ